MILWKCPTCAKTGETEDNILIKICPACQIEMDEEYEIHEERKIPVIYVTRDKNTGFCKFWCRYCSKWHNHGQGDGHRSAHCDGLGKSIYKETGYILKTKEGFLSLIYDYDYTVHLFNFKTQERLSIKINKRQPKIDNLTALKLINSYEDRDYYNTTLNAIKLFSKDKEGFNLSDLQSEGDGMPDFMYQNNSKPSFEDYYIEFKSESDQLRLNQLYSFIELAKHFDMYLLHIDKKRFIDGKN